VARAAAPSRLPIPARDGVSSGCVTFLVVIVLSGWTLASYDFNLLIVAFCDFAKELNLTASFVARVLSAT
jgi:hypothetical protein